MKKNIKLAIVPDVHARDFWREPVKEILKDTDAHIVFLGDYVDPYPFEWENKEPKINFKQKVVDTGGRIDRFTKRFGSRIAGAKKD